MAEASHSGEIAILDFGSQYTHLIARRVRELGVVSHIYPNDVPAEQLKNATGIILSGGPRSVLGADALAYDSALFELHIPILGLCYGHQLMAKHFGGTLASGQAREYGLATLQTTSPSPHRGGRGRGQTDVTPQSPIFADVDAATTIWMSHGDHVATLPPGFTNIGITGNDSITAMADDVRKFYGFQFHPEVAHSKQGRVMLKNFLFDICGAKKNWTTADMLAQIQEDIRVQAGNKKVFLLLSGGVDSTVCFALLEKTLGKDRVYGFHIDHGFMRQNESKEVVEALRAIGLDNLHVYNAEEEYLAALVGIVEPEQKRKIIGNLFLDITDRIMKELGFNEADWLLGQGTIYPDTIESGGTKNADKIKTHHNRVDRIHDMIAKGLIIEPIKELYKDEVRAIGAALGLPEPLLQRHPFPGPGLAIRCLCADGEDTAIPQIADGLGFSILPIKSVGVQGDERSYKHPALLDEVPRQAGMIDWSALHDLSPTITNRHKEVNRVLFLMAGSKSEIPKAILRNATLTRDRLEKLRQLDFAINQIVSGRADCRHVWQLPIVLVPFGHDHGESLVLRPVESEEAMTVTFASLHTDVLKNITETVAAMNLVDFIFYDCTNKPPGTIEWE